MKKKDIKKTSDNCCVEKLFYFTSLIGEKTECRSDAFMKSD